MDMAQVTRIPQMTVNVDEETAKTVLKLLELLEDHDDVQASLYETLTTIHQLLPRCCNKASLAVL